jgi:hypothetical protein
MYARFSKTAYEKIIFLTHVITWLTSARAFVSHHFVEIASLFMEGESEGQRPFGSGQEAGRRAM